ncbi:MAG: GNAT family N-acetyltransferase [Firmicutes bacterium]|nr:GNAT family N-acetyltransferase [Bacillota bacterium]
MRIRFIKTTESDLENILSLWNDGEVMKYVGFPEGLHMTLDKLKVWLERVNAKKDTLHYSIYSKDTYFGETYYSLNENEEVASLDIKLKKAARGKNIAYQALSFCIDQLFLNTNALRAKVDPSMENDKAIRLYKRLGFQEIRLVTYEGKNHVYMEVKKEQWHKYRINQLRLEDVNFDNFIEVIFLSVKENQINFIASNAISLAQSKYQEECIPKAIYVGSNLVGFLMYCVDRDDHDFWIYRFMIDQKYQGMGYGLKAMEIIITFIKKISTKPMLKISFAKDNEIAKNLYEACGFQSTGITQDHEIVYELKW